MGFSEEDKDYPDPTKQAQEIIFSRKKTVSIDPVFYFDNTLVNSTATHYYLRMILDSELSYENRLQSVFSRVLKTISLFEKISTYSSEKISSESL